MHVYVYELIHFFFHKEIYAFVIHLQPKIRAIMLQNEYEVNHIFMTTVSVGEIKILSRHSNASMVKIQGKKKNKKNK